jgi:hypothetical protein
MKPKLRLLTHLSNLFTAKHSDVVDWTLRLVYSMYSHIQCSMSMF